MLRVAGLALLLTACGEAAAVDAGPGDTGPTDAGVEWPELLTATTLDPVDDQRAGPDAVPADLSCLGTVSWPPAGPARSVAATVSVFTGGVAAGICVRVYPDDRIVASDTCLPTDLRTDAAGRVDIEVPGDGPFAFRMFPYDGATASESFDDVTVFHVREVDMGFRTTLGVTTVSQAFLNLIPTVLGRTRAPGTAIYGTQLYDCAGDPLYGARLRLARADGAYIEDGPARSDTSTFYFDAREDPDRRQPWSHINGYAGVVNIPVLEPGETVFVEVWGRPRGETEPRVVSCDVVQLIAGGQALSSEHRPVHVGGPACPGLR